MSEAKQIEPMFVLCIKNDGYQVDLDVGTVYPAVHDEQAARSGRLRVVDESGEDYLYPSDYFTPVALSSFTKKVLSLT